MQYFGKYRGKVVKNKDPLFQGRLKVIVPSVLEQNKVWAMPCVPYAGKNVGLFLIPPKEANVWIEFEGGNLDFPIWAGCFWGEGEIPIEPAIPTKKFLKTDSILLSLDDTEGEGGLSLIVNPPLVPEPISIKISEEGLELNNNPAIVKLTPSGISINFAAQSLQISPASISLNEGALEVM